MKRFFIAIIGCAMSVALQAVPARGGWHTYTQADGSTVELQLVGDEFAHFWMNRDSMQVRLDAKGMYEVVGQIPSSQRMQAKRAQVQARRIRKGVGSQPNLAPKGVVILVNFADVAMNEEHTRDVFDELCNSEACTVNTYDGVQFPSAAEYFSSQSNGAYRPQFDVYGPVTVSRDYAFYGQNDEDGNDLYPWDAVIEACHLAETEFDIDYTQYDSDDDGYIDFVYVIYAGQGEAAGGDENTIWPHNWELLYAVMPFSCDRFNNCWVDYENGVRMSCCYTEDDVVFDGKVLNNYAMSSELMGYGLGGIGTLCHEFGHVMGLPDLYDTEYEDNYERNLTPGVWNIMDGGSYNGNAHCPPNYDPWQKAFFGWQIPENLGTEGRKLTIMPNGQEGANCYQLNESGVYQEPTQPGLCYYIENRQQQGWDSYLPGHGMLVWKVNFDQQVWESNAPNNTSTPGSPLYTVVSAKGSRIGTDSNTFPGKGHVNNVSLIPGRPIMDINETVGVVTMVYISENGEKIVTWLVNGETLEIQTYAADGSDDLVLPSREVVPCEGTEFVGWTQNAKWFDPFATPEDLFVTPEGKVTRSVTYHALFK